MSLLSRSFLLSSRLSLFRSTSGIFSLPVYFSQRSAPPFPRRQNLITSFPSQFSTSSSPPSGSPPAAQKAPETTQKETSKAQTQADQSSPDAEQLTPEQIKMAKKIEEKRAEAKLAQEKKEEKKRKKEEEKEKAKAQKKSKKELELIAQVERLRAGRIKPIRKWLKPENVRPPSYVWDQDKVFNYFLSHPTLALGPDEENNTAFIPGQPLSHPSRSLQLQTRGTRWTKMNNSLFIVSPWNELLAVKSQKHRIFQRLGFEISIPDPPPSYVSSSTYAQPLPPITSGHRSVINLRMIANDAEKTPILCNDDIKFSAVVSPPSISFEPIYPEDPKDCFYSLFLLNLDYPTHVFPDLSPMILWHVSNIRDCQVELGETIYGYLPPLPPPNSGPHRCVYLFCKQLKGEMDMSKEKRIDSTTIAGRVWAGTNIGEYLKERDLEVQSYRYFRIYWSEDVRKFYESLGIPEPNYFMSEKLLPHKTKKIPGIPGRPHPVPPPI